MNYKYFLEEKHFKEYISGKNVIVFGSGSCFTRIKPSLDKNDVKISYFVDNDTQKWNSEFLNYKIFNPKILLNEDKDNIVILIASMFYREISAQLNNMGFVENVHYINCLKYFGIWNRQCVISKIQYKYPPIPQLSVKDDLLMELNDRVSLNRICDISDWRYTSNEDIKVIMNDLKMIPALHRKEWEYLMCIYGLQKFKVVNENSIAISVGAGHEAPLFYYANKIKKMIATDIYDSSFSNEGNPDMLTNPEAFSSFEYRKDHLEVKKMSGTCLEYEDNYFDFAFSLSSIEHFGSKKNSKQAVEEMMRVVKPGGVICIATELVLNENGSPDKELFTYNELKEYVIGVKGLKLIGGDLDLSISKSLFENPVMLYSERKFDVRPHITLQSYDNVYTSVILFLQKI